MKYLVLLLLLFSAALGRAQRASQTVRGTVLDADSKAPLPGATVLIVESIKKCGAAGLSGHR